MSVAKIVKGTNKNLAFYCEGCESHHVVPVEGSKAWGWNGSLERPTLTPSLLVNVGGKNPTAPICHSFVTDGKIAYLADCTHALAGMTIPLKEIDE